MKNNKFKKGFTLLLSLLVTSVILSVGLGVFNIMTKELKLSGLGRESQIAFYAADAGLECFYYWEIKHPGLDDTLFANRTVKTVGKCADSEINIPEESDGPYDFTLPLSNSSCAKVKVKKSGLITTIESRGYNKACDSNSPFKVERGLRMTLIKEE